MAYRGVKGSDPFVSKTSRNERFAQMSKQEQIIQQKKLEIQAKMQELKAKQAVESVKKNNNSNSTPNSTAAKTNSTKKEEEKPISSVSKSVNLFANDGSFLDQFKKISSNKSNTPKQELKLEDNKKDDRNDKSYDNSKERRWNGDKSRDWDGKRDRRRNESRWSRNSDRRRSSSSSLSPPRQRLSSPPSDSRRYHHTNGSRPQFNNHHNHHQHHHHHHQHQQQQQLPPPPPPLQNQPQQQQQQQQQHKPIQNVNTTAGIPSLMSQPIIPMTNVPPPNLRNIPPNISHQNHPMHSVTSMKNDNYTSIDSNPRMSLPPPTQSHMIRPPPPSLSAPPPPPPSQINTNIPPPNISIPQNSQIPSLMCSSNQPPPSNQQQHIIPTLNNLPTANIPPPNVPPPNLLPPISQMPPNMLQINTQAIVVTVANVSNLPPPPPPPPPSIISSMLMSAPPPPVHTVSSTVPPPNLNIPPPNVPPPTIIQNSAPPSVSQPTTAAHLLSTTYPIPTPMSITRPNVQLPPPVQPPNLSSSSEQKDYRCPIEAEQLARIVAECGDAIEEEVREKNSQDPKLWFLHQKQSPAYQQYRDLVAKFRNEKADKGNNKRRDSGAEPYCPEEALSDSDDVDKCLPKVSPQNRDNSKEESNKEERKRKRRSRWSEPDNSIQPVNSLNSQPGLSKPNLQTHLSSFGKAGASSNLSPKISRVNSKNPMLSTISRSDPALLQYAKQTFGTLDLSEEQWKKAEDHYKINLLYQNLLRKREEVKRLESQGKHKYEYDSDEEVEGGTWEHKLRSAEMEATQMWAEELTAQSEGKHHIGDFLPPEELQKFMEQYNAVKQGKEPDLSDYKEFKLKEDNIGFQMLQKLGWSEGQGLGSEGNGRVEPVNKATSRLDSSGLGVERPDNLSRDDDEFDAYRKRMMLAYRFRPNPLNNPRRPYY